MPRKSTSIPNFSLNWKPLRKSLDGESLRRKASSPGPLRQLSAGVTQEGGSQSNKLERRVFPAPHQEMSTDSYQTICLGNISQFKSTVCSQSQDWLSLESVVLEVFQETGPVLLGAGTLATVHENVRNLLDSNIGSFVYDRYKSQMLKKGMAIIRDRVRSDQTSGLVDSLCDNWRQFYSNVLPALDCILFRVKAKCGLTIRQTTLIAFRDEVIFKTSLEEQLNDLVNQNKEAPSDIKHMLLVLQSIYECYPPSKNKTHIESLTALVISPYQGYKGLYTNYRNGEPVVMSREPVLNAKRKSIDLRSRPLTMQPKQLETLNELFASAIRKNH